MNTSGISKLQAGIAGLAGVALGLWILVSETRAMFDRLALSGSDAQPALSLTVVGIWWVVLFAGGLAAIMRWLGKHSRRVVTWLIVSGWVVAIPMPLVPRLWQDLGLDERFVGNLISVGTALPLGLLLLLGVALNRLPPPARNQD